MSHNPPRHFWGLPPNRLLEPSRNLALCSSRYQASFWILWKDYYKYCQKKKKPQNTNRLLRLMSLLLPILKYYLFKVQSYFYLINHFFKEILKIMRKYHFTLINLYLFFPIYIHNWFENVYTFEHIKCQTIILMQILVFFF